MFKSTMQAAGAALALTATVAFAAQSAGDRAEPTLESANDTSDGSWVETPAPTELCSPEHNTDALVGVDELTRIFMNWGLICETPCGPGAGDYDNDGQTDVMDLILVITNWGACPDAAEEGRKSDQFADDLGDGSEPGPQEPSLAKPEFSEEVGP